MSEAAYLQLKVALNDSAYAGLSDAAAAAALMEPETVWVDVPVTILESHCRLNLIISTLEERVAAAAPGLARKMASELLGTFTGRIPTIRMSHIATREGILTMLGGLQAAEWLTADEVAGIIALSQQQRPKCAALGWEAVSEAEVARARSMI